MSLFKSGLCNILTKSPHDVVIVSALRTPVTRAKKGGLKDAYPEELLAHVLRATLDRTSIDPALINDITIGTVLSELGGAKAGRMAALHAGLPHTTTFSTVNRQCASSLQAISSVAAAIATGQTKVAIAGGMESMTRNYESRAIPQDLSPVLKASQTQDALDCIMPMGLTSENVASRYQITREAQDRFAVASHAKASAAQKAGHFDAEIVPIQTRWIDEAGAETTVTVSLDDGIRHNSTYESLARLKPAFTPEGSGTAGNSSQVSDGAAAVLMMSRSTATTLGLTPLAKWVGSVVVGCRPDEMGIGPALAIPELLRRTGVLSTEVGIWEINEAFASQAVYCVRELGVREERVNPKGGAIALGHPLGATGARQVAGLLPELERQGERVGVVSMCIGTGSGMASMIVRE